MPFTFLKTRIPEVILVEPAIFSDPRGHFVELFKASEFQANGISMAWAQINTSWSTKHVLRGLHFQLNPEAQAKFIGVSYGEIFDVAVDIRRASPTYGQWVAERLSGDNRKMLFVPEGFAHGFCVLSDEAEVVYHCSNEYAPGLERCIRWDDPSIAISWPVKGPILSAKDSKGVFLSEVENNF